MYSEPTPYGFAPPNLSKALLRCNPLPGDDAIIPSNTPGAPIPPGQPLPPDALFPKFATELAAARLKPPAGRGFRLADIVLTGEWRDAPAADAGGAQPALTGEWRDAPTGGGEGAINGDGGRAPDGGGGDKMVLTGEWR